MRLNRRAARPLRLLGLLIAGACIAAAIASLFWNLHWRPSGGLLLSIKEGCARVAWWDPRYVRFDYHRGLSAEPADARWTLRWLPRLQREALSTWLFVPLWIPAAISTLLALWAWRLRLHPDECPRCGYSLQGLGPAAVCPECGHRA